MLTGVQELDVEQLESVTDFTIEQGTNLMVFGPAGTGKTEIGEQRADAASARGLISGYIYLNLSVLEAPDLVGLPYRIEESLRTGDGVTETRRGKTAYAIPEKFSYLGDGLKKTLVCDELDKARPELQNPMLELFQFRSVNGIKLNIRSVYATGNLPDENAFSQPVSHALMNRCSVYKVVPSFDPWMKWAVDSGINALVVGFLSRNTNLLLQPPPSGDDTAYCHPTPRAWAGAARDLDGASGKSVDFQTILVAGRVGQPAAAQFRVWLDHHRHIEPYIDALVKEGKDPGREISGMERVFVFGIAGANAIVQACQRVDAADERSKRDAQKVLVRTVDNVMKWIGNISTEYAIGALKSVLTMDLITRHRLMEIKSFMDVFVKIRQSWGRS